MSAPQQVRSCKLYHSVECPPPAQHIRMEEEGHVLVGWGVGRGGMTSLDRGPIF